MLKSQTTFALCLSFIVANACAASPFEKYGYIDEQGNWAIKPSFESAQPFVNGYATVQILDPKTKKSVTRTINRQGSFIKNRYPLTDDYAARLKRNSKGVNGFGPFATLEISPPNDSYEHYVLANGKPAFDRTFARATEFNEKGIAFAQTKYGMPFEIINRTGKTVGWVLDPRINSFGHWSEGLCDFVIPHRGEDRLSCGYVDNNGLIVIPAQFDFTDDFHEGLAAVMIGQKWYYIDKTGRKVLSLPDNVSAAHFFQDGLAPVAVGGVPYKNQYSSPNHGAKWAFINKKGAFVIPPTYYECSWTPSDSPIEHRLESVLCRTKDGYAYGYIDKTGKIVIPPKFVHASTFSEGLAAASQGDTSFISEQWKEFGNRPEQVAKFFAKYRVVGMPRTKIHELLGNPNSYSFNKTMPANVDRYGVYSGGCLAGTGYSLELEYHNNQVARYRYWSLAKPAGAWMSNNEPPYLP